MTILVCDDHPKRGDDFVKRIRSAIQEDPRSLMGDALSTQLKSLFGRVRACRDKDTARHYKAEASPFDEADVLVLDNNLAYLHGDNDSPPLTAESIAGYIRAFTSARYIVSLNMNPDVDFDLRYLVGDFSTRADLAINTEHLDNKALWSGRVGDAKDSFLPWYWPPLGTIANQRAKQVEFVREHLDEPVLRVFGFDDGSVDLLSLHARGSLSPEAASNAEARHGGVPLEEVTFRHVFLSKDRSLPLKDDRLLLNEAERGGNAAIRDVISRVVAADIDLWFRRDVLGPQEPLVDIPHLLLRLPFLLGNRSAEPDEWNRAAQQTSPPYGIEQDLYDGHISKAAFEHGIWVQRPAFWWSKLKADDQLNERFFAAKGQQWADVAFCEDQSAFRSASAEGGQSPVEFAAEFEGAWNRRFIAKLGSVRYAPRTRLAV